MAVGKPGMYIVPLGKLKLVISFQTSAKNTILYNIMVVLLIVYFSVKVMIPGCDEWNRANSLVMVVNHFCL